jgi:hypothetical protein
VQRDCQAYAEEDKHRHEQSDTLLPVAEHFAKHEGQSGRQEKEGKIEKKIRQGIRAFEWMGCIGIEESAAIGAEMFDGYLRGDRADSDMLGLSLECSY